MSTLFLDSNRQHMPLFTKKKSLLRVWKLSSIAKTHMSQGALVSVAASVPLVVVVPLVFILQDVTE